MKIKINTEVWLPSILLYINNFNQASSVLDLHLFADDSNIFFSHKSLQVLETTINNELFKIHEWLCSNNLLLNISKTNFALFHASQKHVTDSFSLHLNNNEITQTKCVNGI